MHDVFSLTHNKALLYIIVLTFPFLLHSQSFGVKSINTISTTNDPRDAFIADLDGDGDQDVIAAIFQWNDIIWYKNDGNQNFTSNTTIDTNFKYVNEVVVADFNGDGDMDIVGVGQGSPWDIAYYDNNGSESFTKTVIDNLEAATFIVSLDMEGDGDLDIVVTARNSGKMVWYANDGNSNFGTANEIITGLSYIMSPRYADVDNDGDLDLFVSDAGAWNSGCSCRTGNRETFLFLNDGSASFTQSTIDDGNALYLLDIADIDGDGYEDILNTSYTEDKVSWMRNKGDNTFEDHIIVTSSLDNAGAARAVDLDNDGDIDFIVTGGTEELVLFENDGNQNFTERSLATSFGSQGLRTGDIDGDGDLDVIAGSRSNDYIKWIELDSGPSNISLTSNTISETSSIGSLVGTLSATDSDTSSNFFTFSFASGNGTNDADNGSFTISGTSLLTSTTLDYETKDSYTIYINVNDGTSNYAKAFTVSVTNINEAPTDIALSLISAEIPENVSVGTSVGTFSSADPETEDTHSYSFVSGIGDTDNASFTISGTSLLTASVLDYQTQNSYAVRIQTSDGSATYSKTFTISISDSQVPRAKSSNVYRNSTATLYSSFLNGNIVWQESTDGSNWTDVNSGSNSETLLTSSTITFSFTGSEQNWVVPAGVTYIDVDGYGAKGGNSGGQGGLGGRVEAKLLTIPGEDLKIYIGGLGSGNGGFNGGGGGPSASGRGGGATDIRQNGNSLANRIYVAGGGGGGGQNYGHSTGCAGGVGGGLTAGNGHRCGNGGNGGIGGSQTAGGATGGELGVGGAGSHGAQTSASGAGGGGFYGGGGGSRRRYKKGGGGGGGSSYTDSTATDVVHTRGYAGANGNGSLTITTPTGITSTYTSTPLTNNIYYRAVINGVTTSSVTITIVDAPPTDILLTTDIISETASIGSFIGSLSATDADSTIESLTFTFANGNGTNDADNGSFTISGTSLLTNTTLDYETKTSYNIYINVNDGANNYAKAFTVSVTNVLEPITDLGFHISKAYKFNGTNNYIEVPYAAENHPSNFTIELWARLDQDTGTFQSPLSSRYGAAPWNNLSGYNFYAVNGLGSWQFSTGSGGAWEGLGTSTSTIGEIYNGTTLKFGIWTHLASTYDGTTTRFYVNGALVGTDSAGYSRVGFNSIPQKPLRIGAGRTEGSATYFFNGAVDEVRIWNYVRTQNEINNKKNAVLSGQETGLVSYYSFDNGNASNETGVSARDGTLYNSPTIITRNTPYQANIDEESSLGTIVRTLTATDSDTTDFTFSLVSGNGTNDQHNSLFTVSGTQLLVAGNIDYETNSSLNIYVQASDGTNTLAKALTVNVNDINEPPVITATTLSNDNSSISVTFSEAVNASADVSNTLALEVSDFGLSINGGTATLSSTTPSSISVNGNTYTLGLPISGAINGSETVTVVPIINSIYDSGATTASTTQSNNTVSLHGDTDSDGVNDVLDQCPNTPGGASVDVNGCAESQKDPDNDGITGINDNCPNTANSDQTDTDGDGIGDACDPDIDGDGIANGSDNCPYDSNPDQKDSDTDGMGDLCDRDNDNDGYDDGADSFPFDPTEWMDSDNDGTGNNADTDDDNDTYLDTEDAFPLDKKEWLDTDGDGLGNNSDKDDDNDGVEDKKDAFPLDDTEYLDTDKDVIGNNADEDDDGDGYSDLDEIACNTDPLKRSSRPEDYDRDLSPDCIDIDDDNDGCLDQEDLFPLNERECIDSDGDGIGDNADLDADNDGIIDPLDDFPLDPNESKDTDGDGIGDNADLDDNNDGFPEDTIINDAGEEVIPIFVSELLTPNQTGEESTWRIVNIDKYPSANVKIYSPAGEIVYESWDYKNDWDGKGKNGESLPTGPYMYMIDRGDETQVEQGWLYIFN